MSQKDGVKRKRDGEDKKRKDKIGRWPSPERDQTLKEGDEEERTHPHSNSSKPIGHTSILFKPLGENDSEGSDTETRDAYADHYPKKKIEMKEVLNLSAEKES